MNHAQEQLQSKLEIAQSFGGANHWYGLRMRPYSLAAQPNGNSAYLDADLAKSIFTQMRDKNNIRHGVLAYPEKLSERDAQHFDMIPIDITDGSELLKLIDSTNMTIESLSLDIINIILKEAFAGRVVTFDLFDEWANEFSEQGKKAINKYFRLHPAFINRKTEQVAFEKLTELREVIDMESLSDAFIGNYLS